MAMMMVMVLCVHTDLKHTLELCSADSFYTYVRYFLTLFVENLLVTDFVCFDNRITLLLEYSEY